MSASQTKDDLSDEERLRRDELVKLGFEMDHALRLIEQPDIAHAARKLVNQGCPATLAYRILRD